MPRAIGHKYGAETVRRIVEGAIGLGIQYLTLFGFSSENWNRPLDEVTANATLNKKGTKLASGSARLPKDDPAAMVGELFEVPANAKGLSSLGR